MAFKVDPTLAANAFMASNRKVQVMDAQTIPAPDDEKGKGMPQVIGTVTQSQPAMHRSVRRGTTLQERYGGSPPALPESEPPPKVEALHEEPRVQPAARIDLRAMVLKAVEALGKEVSATFFDKTPATIEKWILGKAEPPLDAAQRILEGYPAAAKRFVEVKARMDLENGAYSMEPNREKLDLTLCIASAGSVREAAIFPRCYYVKKYELGIEVQSDTLIIRSRNLIADRFLRSGVRWSIWLDSDVIPPFGNAGMFRHLTRDQTLRDDQAEFDMVKRFLSHNKPFIGGVYSARHLQGPLIIAPDISPKGENDLRLSNAIRGNLAKGLVPVDWVAAGLCLIHRNVFEAVKKRFPELTPRDPDEPFPYFTPTADQPNSGEDVVFSHRARQAGIDIFLDTELVAAHLGMFAFFPNHSAPVALKRL